MVLFVLVREVRLPAQAGGKIIPSPFTIKWFKIIKNVKKRH